MSSPAMLRGGYSPAMTDRAEPVRAKGKGRRSSAVPGSWRVLWWLALRQGRWILIGSAGGAVLLGFIVNMSAARSLAARHVAARHGLRPMCVLSRSERGLSVPGIAAYSARPNLDRKGPFLGDGSCRVDRVDLVRSDGIDLVHPEASVLPREWRLAPRAMGSGWTPICSFFLGLWPLYGFCFGQFFGQTAQRPFIAAILDCLHCFTDRLPVAAVASGRRSAVRVAARHSRPCARDEPAGPCGPGYAGDCLSEDPSPVLLRRGADGGERGRFPVVPRGRGARPRRTL